jgi:hypothetical protein
MKEMSRSEEFRRATAAARQRAAAERAARDDTVSRQAGPADVYLLPGEGDIATRWAVVAVHPDRPHLLFAVPADGNPLFGLADLPLVDQAGRRLTLRCGLGLWLPRDVFPAERRLRLLSAEHLRRAREKLRQVTAGALDGPEAARESEANPDYREWMVLVAAAVERLAAATRTHAVTLTPSDFHAVIPFRRGAATEPTPLALAAASPDMAEEAAGAAVPPAAPPAWRVDLLYPGELFLLLEPDGVAVVYRNESGGAPPRAERAGASDDWVPLAWESTPGGSAARTSVPWAGESVRLRFGEGDSAREVTVSRR